MRANRTDYGYVINYSGNEDGWKVFESTVDIEFEGPFKKLKQLKAYIKTLDLEEPEEPEESTQKGQNLWHHACPACLPVLEYEGHPMPESVKNTLDCYGLITPEGEPNFEYAKREKSRYCDSISLRSESKGEQGN